MEPALRSLAEALEAGVSLRALAEDPALSAAWPPRVRSALRKNAAAACSLGDALRDTRALDDGPAAIVDAGERGGFLPKALRLAADAVAAASARRRRAFLALAYPAFLVAAAGAILPLPLAFTSGPAAYLDAAAPFEGSVALALVIAFLVLPRLPTAMRARLDGLFSGIPIVGTIVVEDARAACFEILGALLGAGASLTSSLPAAVRAAGLSSWRFGLGRAETVLSRGGTLAEALAAGGFVDDARAGRISVAERSGTLDRALPALAQEAHEIARRRFTALAAAGGLACFLAVAAAVGLAMVRGLQSYVDAVEDVTKE